MTIKTLSGTYSAGYTLSSSFTTLSVTAAGLIGGRGLVAAAPATITSYGRIEAGGSIGANGVSLAAGGVITNGTRGLISGGQGQAGAVGGEYGHAGGAGIIASAFAALTNHGVILGGSGGAGAGAAHYGYGGGTGGAGAAFTAGANLTNLDAITGGHGGVGFGGAGYKFSGGGGAGGAGVVLSAGAVTNQASITGGGGGSGAYGSSAGGIGGAGGAGATLTGGSLANAGRIAGGLGGDGAGGGYAGNGGVGGAGVSLSGAAGFTNTGEIVGGQGGLGGAGVLLGGVAGVGGVGVALYGSGSLVNAGTIAGGAGGASGGLGGAGARGDGVDLAGGGAFTNGAAGDTDALISGGIGVYALFTAPATVINFATIQGVAYSVKLGTARDALIAEAGASFIGQIAGGGGRLELAGGTGQMAGLGATGVLTGAVAGTFSGFSSYVIDAGGAWTLTGTDLLDVGKTLTDNGALIGGSLTNNGTILGAGSLGGGGMTLLNKTGGIINGAGSTALVIDTGANSIVNAGLIEATGAGGLIIQSAVGNFGTLEANGGVLTVNGAVSGAAAKSLAVINGGLLDFTSTFNENVTFAGGAGVLELAQSQAYGKTITGFSRAGGTSLDLADIGFVGAGEATYVDNGLKTGGVLTVSDGTHTAHITLAGDYSGVTFIASGDGHGGVIVTDGAKSAHWSRAVNGSFQTGSGWTAGFAPGPGNDAILDAPGSTKYTVTASASQIVGSLQTAASATLDITGAFTATGATGSNLNAGRISVANGASFTAGGTLANSGFTTLSATSGFARLVAVGALTLTGGGELFMGDNAGDIVVGASASATLINIDNAIAGSGNLGGGALTLINDAAGVIASEGHSTPLIIDTGVNTIVNAGLIEAAGAGAIIKSAVNNSGILKADGGNLTVNGAVSGAGLAEIAGGTLDFTSTFNQNVAFVAAAGVLELAKSQSFTGAISGFSATGGTSLDLIDIAFGGSTQASYSGTSSSGVLTVTDGTHTAHVKLTGNYTGGAFSAAADGHGGTTVKAGPAAIHWLNAVSAGFTTAADWTLGIVPGANNDAILDAPGSTTYTVTVSAAQTVKSIQTAATATLDITGAFTATAGTDGGANAGRISVANGASFTAAGTLANAGLIALGASSGQASLIAAAALTLTGAGEVFMGENVGDAIVGAAPSVTLTNVDNIIAGGGSLGGGRLTLVNGTKGQIQSEGGALLIIDTGANTIANAGLIEAAGAGAIIRSAVNNSGVLKADGGNLTVNGAVSGTGLAEIGGGILDFTSTFNQNVAFVGAAGGGLELAHSQAFTGAILGFSLTGATSLDLADIAFGGSTRASYSGTASSGVLTVTDGTHIANIHLTGNYTGVAFTAAADGHGGTTIADGPKARHWLNPAGGAFTTAADWTGGAVPGAGNDAILDAAGGPSYTVTASANQTVAGVATAANAILSVTAAFTATAGTDGGANAGRISVANGGAFAAGGTLGNSGFITLSATSGLARLVAVGTLTLTGGGELFMGDNAGNIVVGASASATLINVDNAIAGAGNLGGGALTLINDAAGVIASEDHSTPLIIDTGAATIVNAGLIEAAGAGAIIRSAVNNSGVLKADGGNLTVNGAVSGTGFAEIAGGILDFTSTFNQNVAFVGAAGGGLELARSQAFTGAILGFSKTGATSLDLNDIAFGGSTRATYSGTATSGTLTVTDGTHTARITLIGDYRASTFTAASDGHGGTVIHDPAAPAPVLAPLAAAAPHRLIAAMAGLGADVGAPAPVTTDIRGGGYRPILGAPRSRLF